MNRLDGEMDDEGENFDCNGAVDRRVAVDSGEAVVMDHRDWNCSGVRGYTAGGGVVVRIGEMDREE